MQSINGSNADSLLPGFRFSLVSLNMASSLFLRLTFEAGALQRKDVESSRVSPSRRRLGERRRTGVHPWPVGLCLSIWEAGIEALR